MSRGAVCPISSAHFEHKFHHATHINHFHLSELMLNAHTKAFPIASWVCCLCQLASKNDFRQIRVQWLMTANCAEPRKLKFPGTPLDRCCIMYLLCHKVSKLFYHWTLRALSSWSENVRFESPNRRERKGKTTLISWIEIRQSDIETN